MTNKMVTCVGMGEYYLDEAGAEAGAVRGGGRYGWRLWVGRAMVTGTFRHILSIPATRIRTSNLNRGQDYEDTKQ